MPSPASSNVAPTSLLEGQAILRLAGCRKEGGCRPQCSEVVGGLQVTNMGLCHWKETSWTWVVTTIMVVPPRKDEPSLFKDV